MRPRKARATLDGMPAKKRAAKPKPKRGKRLASAQAVREIRKVLDHPIAQLARAVMPQAAAQIDKVVASADASITAAGERAREGLATKSAPFDAALASAIDGFFK